MTTLTLDADMLHNLSIVAEDDSLMQRASRYLRRLVREKQTDDTLLSKEEFFARVDEAAKGPSRRFANTEELDQYIRSL